MPTSVYLKLVVSLVLFRHEYGNATRPGRSAICRLQSVLNAAIRSIAGLHLRDHITDALVSFHWLRAPECVQFKLVVMSY